MKFLSKIIEHKLFQISLAIKGIHGIIEILTGAILIFINNDMISIAVQKVFGNELAQDPNDFFANLFVNAAARFSVHWQVFFSIYMIVHGIASIAIVIALTHKKLWAFPIVGVLLACFVMYQIYQFFRTYSIIILLLIIVDMVILLLLHFEYDRLRKMLRREKKLK